MKCKLSLMDDKLNARLNNFSIKISNETNVQRPNPHPFNVTYGGNLDPDDVYRNFKYRLSALEETAAKILAKLGMEND